MADDESQNNSKIYKWETVDGLTAVPKTTRWNTPRQSMTDLPRMAGTAESQSAWRGYSTPTPTTYSVDTLKTPIMPSGGFIAGSSTPSLGGATPKVGSATPLFGGVTPNMGENTPFVVGGATPFFGGVTPSAGMAFGMTPNYQFEGSTPVQSHFASQEAKRSAITANIEAVAKKMEKEWRQKNKRLTPEYLDSILPAEFVVVAAPDDYNPLPPQEPNFYEQASKSLDVFVINQQQDAAENATYDIPESLGDGMPPMKPEDAYVFDILIKYHGVNPIPDEVLPQYLLMKNLFKIKNGDNNQRRIGIRYLVDKARIFGSTPIFQFTFHVWRSGNLGPQEKHYFVDFVKSVISHFGKEVIGSTKEIVHMMEALLSAQESTLREDGKQVLLLLTRTVGYEAVFDAIRDDFAHSENSVRRHTAKVVGIIGCAAGADRATKIIKGMSLSDAAVARQVAARAIGEFAGMIGRGIISELTELVSIFSTLLRDEHRVRRDAASALAYVAEAIYPYGIEELEPLVHVVREECKKRIGSTTGPFIRAFGALIPLMAPYDAKEYTSDMMPTLVNQFSTPDDEHRRVLLSVVRKCVSADGVKVEFIKEVILDRFVEGFWTVHRVAADQKTAVALTFTTMEIAKKLGSREVLALLVQFMKDENEDFQRLVIHTVKKIVEVVGTSDVPGELVRFLLDGAIAAVKQDETGLNRVVGDGLCAICISLGPRLKDYLKSIFDLIKVRRDRPEGLVRAQATEILSRIAEVVCKADGIIFLQGIFGSLYESLLDEEVNAMSANLKAIRSILIAANPSKFASSIRELLKRLKIIIRNRHNGVQMNAILLIEYIAANCDENVDAIDLHDLATHSLFQLLDAERRETRRICARTFGIIAQKIRPFAIILELVENFKQDKRKIRICTAVALGSIAKSCGPFTVIPYLLNEYKISEGEKVAIIIQHSILKAIRYMFEFIGSVGKEYAYPLLPLLERALTESEIQQRRMAVEACRAIVMSLAGNDGFEDLTIHLLNFVHPNIVELLSKNEINVSEERLKMITAVVSFYEAARLAIGSGKILQYLLQGLFHPARKVRDIYRRTYNMIYIASPEALVPFYPKIEDDPNYSFTRRESEVAL